MSAPNRRPANKTTDPVSFPSVQTTLIHMQHSENSAIAAAPRVARHEMAAGIRVRMPKPHVQPVLRVPNGLLADIRFAMPLLAAHIAIVLVAWMMQSACMWSLGRTVPQVVLWNGVAIIPLVVVGMGAGLVPGVHAASVFRRQLAAVVLAAAVSVLGWGLRGQLDMIPAVLGLFAVVAALLPAGDITVRQLLASTRWWPQPVLLVGSVSEVCVIRRWLQKNNTMGLVPVGPNSAPRQAIYAVLGRSVDAQAADRLFWQHYRMNQVDGNESALMEAASRGGLFASRTNWLNCSMAVGIKRVLELALIGLVLPFLLPLLAVVAGMVWISSPGPIFYKQARIGKSGNRFFAWKFRTMVQNAEQRLTDYLAAHPELRDEWERDHKLRDDPRVTSIGGFLRKSSLDELPQLWNVVRGEMSLVGPRPIPVYEESAYGDVRVNYGQTLPGITGLWQISGRNNTTYQERLQYDRHYVRNWSIGFDLYILMKTIRTVLLRDGAY